MKAMRFKWFAQPQSCRAWTKVQIPCLSSWGSSLYVTRSLFQTKTTPRIDSYWPKQVWEHRGQLPYTGRKPQFVMDRETLTHLWAESTWWGCFVSCLHFKIKKFYLKNLDSSFFWKLRRPGHPEFAFLWQPSADTVATVLPDTHVPSISSQPPNRPHLCHSVIYLLGSVSTGVCCPCFTDDGHFFLRPPDKKVGAKWSDRGMVKERGKKHQEGHLLKSRITTATKK